MDDRNELSNWEEIILGIEGLSKEEKIKVLNKIKDKYFVKFYDYIIGDKNNDGWVNEKKKEYKGDIDMSGFSDFLKKKKAENQQEEVNWKNVKSDWQQQLKLFMNHIENWLSSHKSEMIEVKKKSITIQEDHLGLYDVPSMELTIASEKIEIQPIGRLIIGAKGRIDIISSYDKYIVLFLDDRGWVYRKEANKGKFNDFTKENLEKMIEDLL